MYFSNVFRFAENNNALYLPYISRLKHRKNEFFNTSIIITLFQVINDIFIIIFNIENLSILLFFGTSELSIFFCMDKVD